MTIEHFTRDEFVLALLQNDLPIKSYHAFGEWVFDLELDLNKKDYIRIRSSIAKDTAADTGKDSIRIYLILNDYPAVNDKEFRWVTRLPGWDERMNAKIADLLNLYSRIGNCPECGRRRKLNRVKKEGVNHGKLFVACFDHFKQSFELMEE